MKISYNWLLDFLTVKPSVETIADILTAVGLEVEDIARYETYKGGLEGLVVGHVVTLDKHPDADRLRVTGTDIGNGQILQIVCGASNVAVGQKVVVATNGTVLYPFKGDSFTIKKSKIRGVESYGMICAEDEIGLSDNHDGIIVLDDKWAPGTPLRDVYPVYSDYTIEVNITPNRGDAMSMLGMARDIACWYAIHKATPQVLAVPSINEIADTGQSSYALSIADSRYCKRYSGLLIQHITVRESPEWLKNRLSAVGLKPINNIVDATNYIMYAYGQPLHAFDASCIRSGVIRVKSLPQDTLFTTLDNKEIKLHHEDIMICDGDAGLCIAGVYGGLHSGVSAQTTSIFLESACFDPIRIRKTAVRHQLRTDAALRFEKQTDVTHTVTVLGHAAKLIQEIAGGEVVGPVMDAYPGKQDPKIIALRYDYLNALAGFSIAKEKADLILSNLGFEKLISADAQSSWLVPGYKNDCTIEEDLVEEVMRIIGYDQIPVHQSLNASVSYSTESSRREAFHRKLQQILQGLGFSEVQNNSIYSAQLTEQLLPENRDEIIRLLSFSNSGLDSMRTSMVMPLLNVVRTNINRRELNLHLFEMGTIYQRISGVIQETQKLCLVLTGRNEPEYWRSRTNGTDLFQLKGFVESLFDRIGLHATHQSELEHRAFDYGLSISSKKKQLGVIGAIATSWLETFDIKQAVFYAEFDVEQLFRMADDRVRYREPSKFPQVRRDLALLIPSDTPFASIEKLASQHGGSLLRDINLFDVYRDKKMGDHIKSYAVSFTFMDETKTLVDADVDAQMLKLMTILEQELKAVIRK